MKDRKYHRNYSRKYYHTRRNILFKMLGGKCVQCGSRKRLTFDHIKAGSRKILIGKLLSYPWRSVLREIRKCQILCFPCHQLKSRTEGSFSKNRARGSMVGTSKLNEKQVAHIKREYPNRSSQLMRTLAIRYGVKFDTICGIMYNRSWTHIPYGSPSQGI